MLGLPEVERRLWVRLLPPDDAADLLQATPDGHRQSLMRYLDASAQREVAAMMAYAEDEAGGLMSTRCARLRPETTVDEAFAYLCGQAGQVETIYYGYVLDREQRLLGVASFRDLFSADRSRRVEDVMRKRFISVGEDTDQEDVAHLFEEHGLLALPISSMSRVA